MVMHSNKRGEYRLRTLVDRKRKRYDNAVDVFTTKKDTSVTFWAERIFFCHTYDTSMTIIVTKLGIIIDVVGSYFYDKKS